MFTTRKFFYRFALAVLAATFILAGSFVAPAAPAPEQTPRLTVLYDNTAAAPGLQADWGFACLIEGMDKTILFDTGTKPGILQSNVKALGVDLKNVEAIVISHLHGDHTGGLESVLNANPRVTLYMPAALSEMPEKARLSAVGSLNRPGTTVVLVDKPMDVCPGVHLTGQLSGPPRIPEVALWLEKGTECVLITGCAHPGIVDVVRKATELSEKHMDAVLGGFHLMQTPAAEVERIIADMKAAGVRRCGATHCTGEAAIALFRTAFGPDFIPLGVGRKIDF